MRTRTLHRLSPISVFAIAAALAILSPATAARQATFTPWVTPAQTGCSDAERRDAFRDMQRAVMGAAPTEVPSLRKAVQPGGELAGWRPSHGYVVLAGAGGVVLDKLDATDPLPQLLVYAPSPTSSPDEWLDFDGPDDPYRLVGWAYIAPYTPGSSPPQRQCIAPVEWMVHEAGWHLKDGGMHLTPGAQKEPPRPPSLDIFMWHPQVWDIHFWAGDDGVPAVTFANPNARVGGRELPDEAFYYLIDGKKRLPTTGLGLE